MRRSIGMIGLIVVAMMLAMTPTVSAFATTWCGNVTYPTNDTWVPDGWTIYMENVNVSYPTEPWNDDTHKYMKFNGHCDGELTGDDDWLYVNVTSPDGRWYGEFTNRSGDMPVWYGKYLQDITVYEQEQPVDNTTTADILGSGTVSGIHEDTHGSDGVYQSITEVLSTGNPVKNRYSYLEHKWTIDVIDGSKANVTFYLEAHHSLSSDGDDFVFAYSTDDSTYADMVTVIKTADDNTYQTSELPNDLSGTVYIRVKDTDQTAGNKALDTISIDQMFIRSESGPPSYGVTATIDEASQTVAPGNGTTYTIRVKNTGDLDASYSVVMSGTAVTEATIDVSPLNWNTGTLAPNAENVQTVTVSTNSSTPETTYTLTATATCDQDASVTDSATSELVVSSAGYTDDKANADIPVAGTVTGSYLDTYESGNGYESVTEIESGGNPVKNRYSYLEHKWTIDVIDGSKANVTFYLEAHHSLSSDGDDFVFAYSTDDSTYADMVTVIKTADDNTYQTSELPNDLSGTVYIRVKDTDQTAGNKALDTISIDQMFIRSESGPPSYGVTATIDEASQTVAPGNGTTYTIRVKNTGDLDASYSVVMSGTAVTEATIDVSPLNWNTGTLAPNAENVQTVTVSTNSSTPETTYTLTATATCDQDASVTDSATSELVVSSAGYTDDKANADIPVAGTVTGSYLDTYESGNGYESVTEIESGGNPAKNRYSYLEHKWTIDVIDGSKANVTFYLEAHHSLSSDGDDFVFAYSTDDSTYADMVTVIKTADDNTYQTSELPNDLSGTVYIRVKDTDQTAGNKALDTISIDQMFIRSE